MMVLVRWFWLGGWQLSACDGEGDMAVQAARASRLFVTAAADLKYAMGALVTAFGKNHPSAKGNYLLLPEENDPLGQGYVVLKRIQDLALAQSFAEFLATEAARAVVQACGFSLPEQLAGPSYHEL